MNPDSGALQKKPRINWSEISQRVEAARQALEEDFVASPEASRATLKARARLLADEPPQADPTQEILEIVEFRLANEIYGIESAFVREVFPLKDFTPLPGVPPFVLGIANIRGQILSIIDLKKFFGLPQTGLGQLNKLIILRDENMEFAILADDILDTHSIAIGEIQNPPSTISGPGADYLRGVIARGTILLDAGKILRDEKIIVDQAAE